jgi:phosphonate transport system substrate-binding protein
MKIRLFILLLILSWGLFGCQGAGPAATEVPPSTSLIEDEEAMVFGIFPYLSPARLEVVWTPIIAEFNRSSAVKLQFRTSSSFDDFHTRLNSIGYDFALIQPFDYIQTLSGTYEPLVRIDEPLSGIFVVRTDSDIQDLSGLANKTVSTPPETAAVTILAEITLNNMGIENVTYSHQNSHDQCLHLLLIAEVDACITNIVPLRTFEETLNQEFTILDSTIEIPHTLIAAHARTTREQKESLSNFFLGLNTYEEGKQLLANAGVQGFVEAADSDYDIVRRYWTEFRP